MSQAGFGKKLGVTRSSVSNMETGRFSITETMLLLICKEFNVSEHWLRTGEGEMFVESPSKARLIKNISVMTNEEADALLLLIKKLNE